MYYVYVLQSKKDHKLYTGVTQNLRERFKQHNRGEVFSTKSRGPFKLIYYEACLNQQDVYQRERYLKSGPGKSYLKKRLKRSLPLTGFTLVELLVSLAIITLIVIAAAGIYIYALGSQQKTTANIDLQEDGQNLLTLIAKDIRANHLDYGYYPSSTPSSPEDELALIDDTDSNPANYVYYTYKYVAVDKSIERCQKTGSRCEEADFATLTMADVKVEKLDFYIYPLTDPYATGTANITSVRVTTALDLSSQKERFGQKYVRLQETVISRYEEKK